MINYYIYFIDIFYHNIKNYSNFELVCFYFLKRFIFQIRTSNATVFRLLNKSPNFVIWLFWTIFSQYKKWFKFWFSILLHVSYYLESPKFQTWILFYWISRNLWKPNRKNLTFLINFLKFLFNFLQHNNKNWFKFDLERFCICHTISNVSNFKPKHWMRSLSY